MANTTAAQPGVPITLQNAQSATGNGLAIAIVPTVRNHNVFIIGSAGVASGKVTIETADNPQAADANWSQVVGGEIAVVADTQISVPFTGMYPALRVRISTVLVGGTVTVKYEGA